MEGEERTNDRLRCCQERQESRRDEIRKGMVLGKEKMRRLGRASIRRLARLWGQGPEAVEERGLG